ASTVVINAYLQPVMQKYLENLERRARALSNHGSEVNRANASAVEERRFSAAKSGKGKGVLTPAIPRIFVMQSSGGITALATAAREPVRTVFCGPAGGVVGAAAPARRSGFHNIIAFDMGGTSTDVSLVEDE